MNRFKNAKTFFQTNRNYDPRLDIPSDAVVVHPHNVFPHDPVVMHDSWKGKTALIGRMFFADSDDLNEYWSGKWDGRPHSEDIEIKADGERMMCSGIRPYMVPTDGWIAYLRDRKAAPSLENGIDAVLPEEPLGHTFTGYESSLKELHQQFYGTAWESPAVSLSAHYRNAQLKAHLYQKLEGSLCECTKAKAKQSGRTIDFVVPIHSLFSNIAARLTAPLGLSLKNQNYDGYIGQIWTGPVNWCLNNYNSAEKSFFASAITLYDYFVQLVTGTDKKLWLLVDPVEDDPHHTWADFRSWYEQCATAMLMMREVNSYEIMPWPERIFLPISFTPGIDDKADNPTPRDYFTLVLSITQALQDMPLGGNWADSNTDGGLGIAIADSAMWQSENGVALQGLYALRMPLLLQGILARNFVMERLGDTSYTGRFKVIVLSYENCKPYDESMHENLAGWVANGGVLLIFGAGRDALDADSSFWWSKQGRSSALDALLTLLKYKAGVDVWSYGAGSVLYDPVSPAEFAQKKIAEKQYLPRIEMAYKKAGIPLVRCDKGFAMNRGDYTIAYALRDGFTVQEKCVDVFSPDLAVSENVSLPAGKSGLFKRFKVTHKPGVIHTTCRLMEECFEEKALIFTVRGPQGTDMVARVSKGGRTLEAVFATSGGNPVDVCITDDGDTLKVTAPNSPDGVTIELSLIEKKELCYA